VLVNTAAGMAVGNPYVNIGCGMGYEATMYLTTRGVRVTAPTRGAGTRPLP
jgi:hypothetical protein